MRYFYPEPDAAPSGDPPCAGCSRSLPTRSATFESNIGLIFTRLSRTISGDFCKDCLSRFFWEYTLTTLVCGWWGVISFFRTLLILPANVIEFVSVRFALRKLGAGANQASALKADARVVRGRDVEETVELTFAEARAGTSRSIRAADGANHEVTIPAGVEDGSVLRLVGRGEPAPADGGAAGNLYVILRVLPDSTAAGTAGDAGQPITAAPRRPAIMDESLRKAYLALEVVPGSDIDVVRASYKRLMRKSSPEPLSGSPDKQRAAIELCQRLTEAYRFIEKRLPQ